MAPVIRLSEKNAFVYIPFKIRWRLKIAEWESWSFLTGLELLHNYTPQTQVQFLHSTGSDYLKFKQWRGIVSHLAHKANKNYDCAIKFDGAPDILICSAYNDANPQIIIEPLEDFRKKYERFTVQSKSI